MDDLADALGRLLADITTRATRGALRADPGLVARVRALQGRCIQIECTAPAATWHLLISADGIEARHGPADAAHVIVRGSALELGAWLVTQQAGTGLRVTGDDTLLLELLEIVRSFDPDFSSPLTNMVGEEAAGNLLGAAELGMNALRSLIQGVGAEMQTRATGAFVQHSEMEVLLGGIDDLRLRVDRLAAKVARHEQQRRNEQAARKPA